MTRSPLWRSSVVALALGGALAAPPAWAQQSVSPCTRNVNGAVRPLVLPRPLPVTSTPLPSPLPSAGLAPVTSSLSKRIMSSKQARGICIASR